MAHKKRDEIHSGQMGLNEIREIRVDPLVVAAICHSLLGLYLRHAVLSIHYFGGKVLM